MVVGIKYENIGELICQRRWNGMKSHGVQLYAILYETLVNNIRKDVIDFIYDVIVELLMA